MLKTIGAALAVVLFAITAQAHHSFSASFTDEIITVEGVVDQYKFANPHVVVYFNVTDDNGEVTRWMTEGLAATLLRGRGWSRDTISEGDVIRVTGNSSRNGSPMVSTDTLEFIDPDTGAVIGTPEGELVASKSETSIPMTLADGRPNLTGPWTRGQQQARDGNNAGMGGGMAAGERVAGGMGGGMGGRGQAMPFTEEGAALQAAYDPKDDPQVQCEPPGLIRQTATPHSVQLVQHDDRVVITSEEYGVDRTVYFDDRDLGGDEKTNLGQSIARYDDQKLVIETTHLLSNPTGPGGNALSDQTTTLETYSRNEDVDGQSTLTMELVITDPKYLTETWTRTWTKSYDSAYEFVPNDCQKPLDS